MKKNLIKSSKFSQKEKNGKKRKILKKKIQENSIEFRKKRTKSQKIGKCYI